MKQSSSAALAASILVGAACTKPSPSLEKDEPRETATPSGSAARKQLTPTPELRVWLERARGADGKPLLVTVPLVLKRGATGFELRDARIGVAPDGIIVVANDAALGIGLADRARKPCASQRMCSLVVDGYYRGDTFDVVNVREVLATTETLPTSAKLAE